MSGEFFAVGLPQFRRACQLGMNPAIALLVMARGTLGDNSTTNWSGYSVYNRTGISRRRAKAAIECLAEHGLLEVLKKEPRPKYKLQKPDDCDELIWLPNTLVDGAGDETPPLTKLREFGHIKVLEKFILLYHEQDLEADGGIPRTIARVPFSRTRIDNIGPFTLYGFTRQAPTASSIGIFCEFSSEEDADGNKGAWQALCPLLELGLIEEVYYMAESNDDESELIYPVNSVTQDAIEDLWDWIHERELFGCINQQESFDYFGVAPTHIRNAWLVGCYRLHYRPHTTKTARWWAQECKQSEDMTTLIHLTCRPALSGMRAHQG